LAVGAGRCAVRTRLSEVTHTPQGARVRSEFGTVKMLPGLFGGVDSSVVAALMHKAHVIKGHHNVGGLPEYMSLKLVEPLC
jgi:GMP synthase PP-ATPase subunit